MQTPACQNKPISPVCESTETLPSFARAKGNPNFILPSEERRNFHRLARALTKCKQPPANWVFQSNRLWSKNKKGGGRENFSRANSLKRRAWKIAVVRRLIYFAATVTTDRSSACRRQKAAFLKGLMGLNLWHKVIKCFPNYITLTRGARVRASAKSDGILLFQGAGLCTCRLFSTSKDQVFACENRFAHTFLSVAGNGLFFKRRIINTSVNKSRAAKFYWHTLFICIVREKRAETLARAPTCARLHARCFIFSFYLCHQGKHGGGGCE